MTDARFEDADRPLRLAAETVEDLAVISALAQDAVGRVGDAAWQQKRRRFVAVLNRFRWEDRAAAEAARRPFERVRAMLTVEHVLSVKARGVALDDREAAFAVLSIGFESGEDGAGVVRLRLSGGGDVAMAVEALELTLVDVARPHVARGLPRHEA
jgi:hypothetical protein